jgi:hypothetical protein
MHIIHEADATARAFIGNLIFICFWDLVFLQLFVTVQILLLLCQGVNTSSDHIYSQGLFI